MHVSLFLFSILPLPSVAASADGAGSCTTCGAGFAPPACDECLPGYMKATDPLTGKPRCYNGATDCHDLLPAPWGCGGRGTCTGCPSEGREGCHPHCICDPGFIGRRCEGTVAEDTGKCAPEGVHLYSVFPKDPVEEEDFAVVLWGCNLGGEGEEYEVVQEGDACGAAECRTGAGRPLQLRYEDGEGQRAASCTPCGECNGSPAWQPSPPSDQACKVDDTALRPADSLSDCHNLCETTPGCAAVDYSCEKRTCTLLEAPCGDSPGSWALTPVEGEPCSEVPAGRGDEFMVLSTTAGCEGDAAVSVVGEARAVKLEACAAMCSAEPACRAFDYFCETQRCKLYDVPCATPRAVHHSPASFARKPSPPVAAPQSACTAEREPGACFDSLVTFDEASATCSSLGRRLCYQEELKGGACCGSACNHYPGVVWTLDAYPASRSCPSAMAQAARACPASGEVGESCQATSRRKKVACCNGVPRCFASRRLANGTDVCYGEYTMYQEAEDICAADGKRLCTADELKASLCCGLGCGLGTGEVWTSSTGQTACTDQEIAGQFANPGGMYSSCPQDAAGAALQYPEQCRDKDKAVGSIRCCRDTPQPSTPPQDGGCTGRGGRSAAVPRNGQEGCFTVSSRRGRVWSLQGGRVVAVAGEQGTSVRPVAPFLQQDQGCSVSPRYASAAHPSAALGSEPCALRASGACPTCTAALQLCDDPSTFLMLDNGFLAAAVPPADVCAAYDEAGCFATSGCEWRTGSKGNRCVTLRREKFAAAATFTVWHGRDYAGHTGFEVGGQLVVADGAGIVSKQASLVDGASAAWMLSELPAASSTDAVLPQVQVRGVRKGGVRYKVCHRRAGSTSWQVLHTINATGARVSTFPVLDLRTAHAAAGYESDKESCCDDGWFFFEIICIPWWVFLIVFLLLLLASAALKRKTYQQEEEMLRNNKRYSDFEMEGMDKAAQEGEARAVDDDDV